MITRKKNEVFFFVFLLICFFVFFLYRMINNDLRLLRV